MPLPGAPPTNEDRERNDRVHRPGVVLAVLGLLVVYMYLFSSLSMRTPLPTPQDLAERWGIASVEVLDDDGNLETWIDVVCLRVADPDDRRLILFLVVAAAFLCAYYLPLRHKRTSLVFWTLVAVTVLYFPRAAVGLLFAHLVVYLTFHPQRGWPAVWGGVTGALGGYGISRFAVPVTEIGLRVVVGCVAFALLYRYAVLPMLERPRVAAVMRTLVIQSAILVLFSGVLVHTLGGEKWKLAMGIFLFFYQWTRLMMYHADYKDGLVPRDLPLIEYLSVFLSPGVVSNWNWGAATPQGYAYTDRNYLCEDKNRLALAGLKIWGVALFYALIYDSLFPAIDDLFGLWGVDVHSAKTVRLVQHYAEGEPVTTLSVLLTTYLEIIRDVVFTGIVMHFKVGVWRVCGYRIDPWYNRPWAATNLVTLWPRCGFHYREFLFRAFYLPIFLRFFKSYTKVRIFVATMAAACFANLFWVQIVSTVLREELTAESFLIDFHTWPYFVILGIGIALTALYLLGRKRTRSPWTLDRWIFVDVLSAYATLQFFGLIRIFRRPAEDITVLEQSRLFLVGFGIHL